MWLQTIMGHECLETTQRYVKNGALQQVVLGKALSPMDEILSPRRLGTTPYRRGKDMKSFVKQRIGSTI